MTNRGNAGKGRPKGSPNKVTSRLREAIIAAADDHGRDGEGSDGLKGYLAMLARDEKKTFATLLGRIVPAHVEGDMTVSANPVADLMNQIAERGRHITETDAQYDIRMKARNDAQDKAAH
ncbi:hypothetical protein [Microbaculum marinisediminis]|uniref:Uncharacterized protein n=1 Tax=Microbaculum marinisediminis TaxID=2931392 RepID=A0AAW5QSF7_9HYPH|nr:hypothetical protein [Microbaculum sp. A6E488]MCT8970890.1 hypothetical protein [Microbaculum sp. A6E488]